MALGGEQWKPRVPLELDSEFVKEFGWLLGAFFAGRSFKTIDEAKSFLNPKLSELPHPFSLLNLKEVATRIALMIQANKPILVWGDYDVDGMSGTTLAASFFTRIGFTNFQTYQPHRFDEGYGVHAHVLERIQKEFPFEAVLTVDTGIGAVEASQWLKERNIPFFVTDHHLAPPTLPETPFLINPNLPADESGLGYLCGTGVLFFLLAGIKIILKESSYAFLLEPRMEEFLDLVALATISDQMDLRLANRSLVREGLKRWPQEARPGLKILTLEQFEKSGKKTMDARDVAFSVAPKLNAASRLGQIEKAIQLLRSTTLEEASESLRSLEKLNNHRMELQASALSEAREQALQLIEEEASVLIASGNNWAEGVLGIVAAKLVEEFNLPAIVLSETPHGALRGSMRSPQGFHCVALLEGAREILTKFGGHEQAAGLEISKEKLEAFRAYLRLVDKSLISSELVVDVDGELQEVPSVADVQILLQTAPWGRANPQPLYQMSRLPLASRKVLKEKHIKWDRIPGKGEGAILGFGFESTCKTFEDKGIQFVDVLVSPEVQEYKGRVSVTMKISRLRASVL